MALANDQIAVCSVTKLEILYSARTHQELEEWDTLLSVVRNVPVTATVSAAALTAMRELAARSDGYHRVSLPDYLIAAAAQDAGVGVLHYDHDFDRVAEVMNFESRWIAPAGSINGTPAQQV
jgi:predicted nucleic acid-binding protein